MRQYTIVTRRTITQRAQLTQICSAWTWCLALTKPPSMLVLWEAGWGGGGITSFVPSTEVGRKWGNEAANTGKGVGKNSPYSLQISLLVSFGRLVAEVPFRPQSTRVILNSPYNSLCSEFSMKFWYIPLPKFFIPSYSIHTPCSLVYSSNFKSVAFL